MDIESVSLVVREVFVYRVSARGSNRGYRADDWGLDKPLWTGRLKVTTKGTLLTIILQDSNTGEVFAQCPISNDKEAHVAVEPVIDSSRYFVVRVINEAGQHAFLGLGFAERSDSFDFNVAIQDHFKREKKAAASQVPYTPKHDLSGFKEGQTIHISIKKKDKEPAEGPAQGGAAAAVAPLAGAAPFALRPPSSGLFPAGVLPAAPAPSSSASFSPFASSTASSATAAAAASFNPFASASAPAPAQDGFADWGDFSSAPSAAPSSSSSGGGGGGWVKF